MGESISCGDNRYGGKFRGAHIHIVEGIVLECEAKKLNLTLPAVDVLHLLNSTNFITFVMLYPIIMDWNLLTKVEWQLSV